MTGREDDLGRTLRSVLLEETNAMPVDTHDAARDLRRRVAHTRKRRRVTLAVAASVVAAAVAATVAGGSLGVHKPVDPAQNPEQPEIVAREFLAAFGSFDADTALTYLTDDAIVQGWGTPEQLRLDFAYYRAQGLKQTINDCKRASNSESGVSIQCDFDVHYMKSDEIGLGPYTDNYWVLTIHDGKVVSTSQQFAYGTNGLYEQMWEPFAAWVSIKHPDDVRAMYSSRGFGSPKELNKHPDDVQASDEPVTEETNRLWAQRTAEYTAVVKQNPAAYLDQPKVAAYVAKLDSTCAAAQARVKDGIRANPLQNQAAVVEARGRIMRETISELRALPRAQLPDAVRWPYEGRAFPLLEKFNNYEKFSGSAQPPHDKQPPEWLARRIQQIPGLGKCIFSV